MKICKYCYEWNRSPVTKRMGKDENATVVKICKETGKDIESKTESCNRFKPCTYFGCEKMNFFVTFEICRNRFNKSLHGDRKERNLYSDCNSCKQYRKWIKPLCNEYKITTPQIVKIKRRDAPKKVEIKRRKSLKSTIKHRSRS
ncbi:MAG: hypothetical protein ACE5RH_00565 [Nitrosarchaeum sp.]